MFDPVSLSIAAGLVWIGETLLEKYKKNFGAKASDFVPMYA